MSWYSTTCCESARRAAHYRYKKGGVVIRPDDTETSQLVMAGLVPGLVPAISIRKAALCVHYRDRRDKPGDDGRKVYCIDQKQRYRHPGRPSSCSSANGPSFAARPATQSGGPSSSR